MTKVGLSCYNIPETTIHSAQLVNTEGGMDLKWKVKTTVFHYVFHLDLVEPFMGGII